MQPAQNLPNSLVKPARSPNSFMTPQSSEALLARYRARMREAYADQIYAIEEKDGSAFPTGDDPVRTHNEIDRHLVITGATSL